ncbi:MAG: PH domain-containing protein [Lysobacterales bacterium]
MSTTYKSEVDTWILVVLVATMTICTMASIAVVFSGRPAPWWVICLIVGLGIVLPVWLLFGTKYTLDTKLLKVQSGPMMWHILIEDITSISATDSVRSAPALSLNRLLVNYGAKCCIMISPRNRKKFLAEIEALRRAAR